MTTMIIFSEHCKVSKGGDAHVGIDVGFFFFFIVNDIDTIIIIILALFAEKNSEQSKLNTTVYLIFTLHEH